MLLSKEHIYVRRNYENESFTYLYLVSKMKSE